MQQVILVTGASSGFGALSCRAFAHAGHIVYASMRDTIGRNAAQVESTLQYAKTQGVNMQAIELDVQSQDSADAAIARIIAEQGRLDVVVHNAGHMAYGPAEAFLPEQFSQLYDINVLGTQRVNRAALPHMRTQRNGLLLWVGSSSTRGGTPPYLAPYFAAKAAMDAVAVSYAAELALWGIESSILVPGAFTKGTNHFLHSGKPADSDREREYNLTGPTAGLSEQALKGLAECEPADAEVADVAAAMVGIVNAPAGKRPFRVHVDPSDDGAEVVNAVADRIRKQFLQRIGLDALLRPSIR